MSDSAPCWAPTTAQVQTWDRGGGGGGGRGFAPSGMGRGFAKWGLSGKRVGGAKLQVPTYRTGLPGYRFFLFLIRIQMKIFFRFHIDTDAAL